MRYAVTGATGWLGSAFFKSFASTHPHDTFTVLAHRAMPSYPFPVTVVRGSLEDPTALSQFVDGADVVVHFAAITHAAQPEDYYRINADGTRHLLDRARAAGVQRFVFVSTRAIADTIGAYGISKRQAEEYVMASGIPYTIARFSEVYGPGYREGIGAFVRLVQRVPVVPYPMVSSAVAPLWYEDAVDALARLVMRADLVNRIYTIAGPRSYTMRELHETMCRTGAMRRLLIPVPLRALGVVWWLSDLFGRPLFQYDQISRLACQKDDVIDDAIRDIGFAPRSFEEGFRRLIA